MFFVAQLYLSGFPEKKLEKLRRLVNAAGGLRFNQPSEDLTHVVVREVDQELQKFLSTATHRFDIQFIIELIVIVSTDLVLLVANVASFNLLNSQTVKNMLRSFYAMNK